MDGWTYLDEYRWALPEHIRERIVIDGDCLRWTGNTNRDGYGVIYVNGKTFLAHRYLYRYLTGYTFEPKEVLHHETTRGCRFRSCCNPYHLRPTSVSFNSKQVVPWNRLKTHCPNGHEYDYTHKGSDGYTRRQCRTCRNAHARMMYHKKKARKTMEDEITPEELPDDWDEYAPALDLETGEVYTQ